MLRPSTAPVPVAVAVPSAPAAAIGNAPVPGSGNGIGSGEGSGPGMGSGAGAGSGGNGNGAVNADVPCGFVEFIPIAPPRYVGTTAYERIRATVHFRDGHRESDVFPYPWVYPNGELSDPWSRTNLKANPDAPVSAQLPPMGTNTGSYPVLIRYILEHTTANGHTNLEECPLSRP
jgi:hypothetical protein